MYDITQRFQRSHQTLSTGRKQSYAVQSKKRQEVWQKPKRDWDLTNIIYKFLTTTKLPEIWLLNHCSNSKNPLYNMIISQSTGSISSKDI